MGLFSSKSKVYVSSVVYNLAGDELKRPQYLKTVVIGSVMNTSGMSIGESIVSSYLNGPGMKIRNFGIWARESNYTEDIGQISGSFATGNVTDEGVLVDNIPNEGLTVLLQSSAINNADYEYWSDQFMLDNHPDQVEAGYKADYNRGTNVITITLPTAVVYTLTPADYIPEARYIYAAYMLGSGEVIGPIEEGSLITLDSTDPYPSTSGWSVVYNSNTAASADLAKSVHTVITYSDARPTEDSTVDSVVPTAYTAIDSQWDQIDYIGNFESRKQIMTHWAVEGRETVVIGPTVTTETIAGGVTKTTTVTETKEVLSLVRTYRIDEQIISNSSVSNVKIFIYREGSGNTALDNQFPVKLDTGAFLPFIPIRIDNNFLSDTYLPGTYALAKKAYRKVTKSKIDSLIDIVADNSSLGDIDYGYVVFGVSVNARENICKKYIYNFFGAVLEEASQSNVVDYAAWTLAWTTANTTMATWNDWMLAQSDAGNPLYGTAEPEKATYPAMPNNQIRISSAGNAVMNYDMTIMWNYIVETTGTGLAKPDAKVDELWFTPVVADEYKEKIFFGTKGSGVDTRSERTITHKIDKVTLTWQETPNTWRKLTIAGLKHRNMIYGGKSVDIGILEALADSEESGFIIPLHEDIYRSMGMVDSTQMSTACSFMVFNCYQIVKQKWYQSGLFQVFLIVVMIVIAIYYPPAAGLFGSNAAVGATLGFTGTTAIIVGAAVNAIAAMVLMRIVQAGANAILGDKLGGILGPILAVVAVVVGANMINGGSFVGSFSQMTRAENILKLTNAAGQGYSAYVKTQVDEIMLQSEALTKQYGEEANKITEQYIETFGLEGGIIDPRTLTNAIGTFDTTMEPVNSFLGRTLMTGSEIAELSFSLINDYAKITLTNDLM